MARRKKNSDWLVFDANTEPGCLRLVCQRCGEFVEANADTRFAAFVTRAKKFKRFVDRHRQCPEATK